MYPGPGRCRCGRRCWLLFACVGPKCARYGLLICAECIALHLRHRDPEAPAFTYYLICATGEIRAARPRPVVEVAEGGEAA